MRKQVAYWMTLKFAKKNFGMDNGKMFQTNSAQQLKTRLPNSDDAKEKKVKVTHTRLPSVGFRS